MGTEESRTGGTDWFYSCGRKLMVSKVIDMKPNWTGEKWRGTRVEAGESSYSGPLMRNEQ